MKYTVCLLLSLLLSLNAYAYDWDIIVKNKSSKDIYVDRVGVTSYNSSAVTNFLITNDQLLQPGQQMSIASQSSRKKVMRQIQAYIHCGNKNASLKHVQWPRKNSANASSINKNYFKRNYASKKNNTIPVWVINSDCK